MIDLTLDVEYTISNTEFPTEEQFKTWVLSTLELTYQKSNAELSIRIIDKNESAMLNQTYRKKTGPTNVLSFPMEASIDIVPPHLGDLAICAPLVLQEAHEQNKSIISHWAHLTIHGILHLLGYDHQTDKDASKMEAIEKHIMKKLSYQDPYHID